MTVCRLVSYRSVSESRDPEALSASKKKVIHGFHITVSRGWGCERGMDAYSILTCLREILSTLL
jgi:hypothetical protein